MQLGSYEVFKRLLRDEDGKLPVVQRLVAGAAAGMCSTFVGRPLSVHMTEREICVRLLSGDVPVGHCPVSIGGGSGGEDGEDGVPDAARGGGSAGVLSRSQASGARDRALHGVGTGVLRSLAVVDSLLLPGIHGGADRDVLLLPSRHHSVRRRFSESVERTGAVAGVWRRWDRRGRRIAESRVPS